jgi:hypothetical protein
MEMKWMGGFLGEPCMTYPDSLPKLTGTQTSGMHLHTAPVRGSLDGLQGAH